MKKKWKSLFLFLTKKEIKRFLLRGELVSASVQGAEWAHLIGWTRSVDYPLIGCPELLRKKKEQTRAIKWAFFILSPRVLFVNLIN